MANELDAFCTLWEYVLTTYGYCPKPEYLQEERIYHAIFLPTFHRYCFLSLYVPVDDTDAILQFGYLTPIWKWKRLQEILSEVREKYEFPVLSDEALIYIESMQMEALSEKYGIQPFPDEVSVYLRHPHMVALRDGYGFPFLPNEESVYVRNVQMTVVPLEALQHFTQKIQEIHPLELHTPNRTMMGTDGMCARGIITKRDHMHRFDIWTVEDTQTDRHRAFFHACIALGCDSFETGVQQHLKEIQGYFLRPNEHNQRVWNRAPRTQRSRYIFK